jgi:hypothetical protein
MNFHLTHLCAFPKQEVNFLQVKLGVGEIHRRKSFMKSFTQISIILGHQQSHLKKLNDKYCSTKAASTCVCRIVN